MAKDQSTINRVHNVREFPTPDDGAIALRAETGIFVRRLNEFNDRMHENADSIRDKIERLDRTMERTGKLLDSMDDYARSIELDYKEQAIKFGLGVPQSEE